MLFLQITIYQGNDRVTYSGLARFLAEILPGL